MWLFGYGSLLFKQGFPFAERRSCFIVGYRRLFWQASSDHRGTPEQPGRVVTLRPFASVRCWGAAFFVDSKDEAAVRSQLDVREKNGYQRLILPLYQAEAQSAFADGECYIAAPGNAHDLGCAPLPDIANQIVKAEGPSGKNREYVYRLAEALRADKLEDPHVFRLEALVRSLDEKSASLTTGQ
jgi:glutathione-specific gamma-glutamylcyclotransferase